MNVLTDEVSSICFGCDSDEMIDDIDRSDYRFSLRSLAFVK